MKTPILALVAAATVASASAVTFNFRSRGTDTLAGSAFSVTDATFGGAIGGAPAGYSFVSLTYAFNANFVGSGLTGSVVGGTGTLTLHPTTGADKALAFSFTGSAARPNGDSLNAISVSTLSFALSGSGLVGTGRLTSTLTANGVGTGKSQTTFLSNFETVPEPASMAALTLGVVGLVRRRRS